uniref:Uncharacterized protein n=1 Tax=Rhizophora mucronata TaxID=61149 RepID=A0A2P2J2U6_RHIMU
MNTNEKIAFQLKLTIKISTESLFKYYHMLTHINTYQINHR